MLGQQLFPPDWSEKANGAGKERLAGRTWLQGLAVPANGLRGAGRPGRPEEALVYFAGQRLSAECAERPRIL